MKYQPKLNEKDQKKKQTWSGLTWGYRISRGIKEILCGISTQRRPRKGYVEFPGSWFLVLEFPRDLMQQGWRYLSGISRGKVNKRKILFQKKYVLNPPVCFISGITRCIWSFEGTSYNNLQNAATRSFIFCFMLDFTPADIIFHYILEHHTTFEKNTFVTNLFFNRFTQLPPIFLVDFFSRICLLIYPSLHLPP